MDLNKTYNSIINQLKLNKKARIILNPSDINQIKSKWQQYLSSKDYDSLMKVFCILENCSRGVSDFNSLFHKSFSVINRHDVLISCLTASWPHFILRNQGLGEPISYEYIKILKKLLENNDPKVIEWVLRTIDQLGGQSIILKSEVFNKRPSTIKTLLSKHHRNNKNIIKMLMHRWNIK